MIIIITEMVVMMLIKIIIYFSSFHLDHCGGLPWFLEKVRPRLVQILLWKFYAVKIIVLYCFRYRQHSKAVSL